MVSRTREASEPKDLHFRMPADLSALRNFLLPELYLLPDDAMNGEA